MSAAEVFTEERATIPTPQLTPGFVMTRSRLDPARYWQAEVSAGPTYQWALRGPAGVIVFVAGRHRTEPGVCEDCRHYRRISPIDADGSCWKAWDVGRHSPRPIHPDEAPANDGAACDLLDGRTCYYDGSGLQAFDLFARWTAAGSTDDYLAGELREYYTAWLGER